MKRAEGNLPGSVYLSLQLLFFPLKATFLDREASTCPSPTSFWTRRHLKPLLCPGAGPRDPPKPGATQAWASLSPNPPSLSGLERPRSAIRPLRLTPSLSASRMQVFHRIWAQSLLLSLSTSPGVRDLDLISMQMSRGSPAVQCLALALTQQWHSQKWVREWREGTMSGPSVWASSQTELDSNLRVTSDPLRPLASSGLVSVSICRTGQEWNQLRSVVVIIP